MRLKTRMGTLFSRFRSQGPATEMCGLKPDRLSTKGRIRVLIHLLPKTFSGSGEHEFITCSSSYLASLTHLDRMVTLFPGACIPRQRALCNALVSRRHRCPATSHQRLTAAFSPSSQSCPELQRRPRCFLWPCSLTAETSRRSRGPWRGRSCCSHHPRSTRPELLPCRGGWPLLPLLVPQVRVALQFLVVASFVVGTCKIHCFFQAHTTGPVWCASQ